MRIRTLLFLSAGAPGPAACGSTPGGGADRVRADGTPTDAAVREQLAQDRAECATQMGAPEPGGIQSGVSNTRQQVENCMRSRGWRRGTDPLL